ncbi:cyclic nucleotide-binding domain-containing protein, partial [Halomonas sp. 707D4]|nr:cyclic nucleotide-binding protein [Halomonas sp. 707D4]
MDVELWEIRQHMGQFPPFDGLSDELLDALAEGVEVRYFKTGTDILVLNDTIDELCYIRSGAVEVY